MGVRSVQERPPSELVTTPAPYTPAMSFVPSLFVAMCVEVELQRDDHGPGTSGRRWVNVAPLSLLVKTPPQRVATTTLVPSREQSMLP
jgi:hypothetical protein